MTDPIENVESGSDNLRVYEVGYLILPSIPEEKVPDEVSHITKTILDAGGKILSSGEPVLQPLAYQMEKHIATRNERFNDAYFGHIVFEGSPELAVSLKTELDATTNILRFLLIKTEREVVAAKKVTPTPADDAEEAPEVAAVDEAVSASGQEAMDKEIEELVA